MFEMTEGQHNLGYRNDPDDVTADGPRHLQALANGGYTGVNKKEFYIKFALKCVVHIAILIYFIFATKYFIDHDGIYMMDWCNGYGFLLVILGLFYLVIIYDLIVANFHHQLKTFVRPVNVLITRLIAVKFVPWLLATIVLALILIFLVLDTKGERERLISLLGLVFFLAIGFIFSKHRSRINWRTVITGLILQFVFGMITIRWSVGRAIFQCLGDKVTTFLGFTSSGASFVFGDFLAKGNSDYPAAFAFSALAVIFFISFIVSILYYYGIMQSVVTRIGWGLGVILGTTICESVNSAANIFLGMTESPLLLKPYLQDLTKSEMHSVMASGFATVSGTVLAAYISFGAQASHLITASVMSAPAALCFSKLFYPEIETSRSTLENIKLEESTDSSVLDAATKGANAAIEIIMGIIANVIAFVSFITFLNATVSWLGILVGRDDPDDYITFEWIIGRIFIPISWLMGVEWDQCEYVGNLIALKTVINEFAAYQKLGEYKNKGYLTSRTEMIATYAVCGFSNPGSIGIMIGGMTTLVPHARQTITELSLRAFISGAIVCFMTACIAGVLVTGNEFSEPITTIMPPITTTYLQ